jgi:cytidyltransferase-like protein
MTIVVVSGGFDPLHAGHVDYLNAAAQLGCQLVVLLNSDPWLTRKKGKPFMNADERGNVVGALKCVDEVYLADDDDDTVVESLRKIREGRPTATIVFANGGDRIAFNTPEMNYCYENNIILAFNVGGKKIQSSSSLIAGATKNV